MNKDLRNTLVWMIFATCVVGLAFWQAQVTVAQEMAARHKVLPQPAKTRHAIRPAPVTFTGDPAADYIARSEKGITDREIGWIVEDFRNAGLAVDLLGPNFVHRTRDELTGRQKEFLDRRAAQYRWYHDALVDGLRLSPEQSSQASKNLNKLFDLAKAHFDETFNAPMSSDKRDAEIEWETIAAQHPMEELITSYRWINDENLAFMPWNLCPLTPNQEKLTWKSWVDKTPEEKSAIENQAKAAFEMAHDPLSRILPYPSLGFGEFDPTFLLAPVYFRWPNLILPFLNQQKFLPIEDMLENQSPGVLLAEIRALHPAQLKLLLLFEPERSAEILRDLNGEDPLKKAADLFEEATDPSKK